MSIRYPGYVGINNTDSDEALDVVGNATISGNFTNTSSNPQLSLASNSSTYDTMEYKAKQASVLKTHKAMIHDIDVTYYLCNAVGCEYKANDAGSLKTHNALIHDIDVIYYLCNAEGCDYKAKTSSNLNKHKKRIHGIS